MKRLAILSASIALLASAQAGSPSVTLITPGAGQRGTEVEVVCSGARLADARTLLFNEPGIEVLGISEVEAGKFKAKLKIAADARIGEYVFRAITNSGIADTRLFYVSPYPVQKEAEEDKVDPYKVQTVPLGISVYGSTPGEDQDHFEVEAKKGQRITAEVVAMRLSTQNLFDAYMRITDAAGKVLAEMDDGPFTQQDPALSIIAPADGKYRVIIKEATNSGQGACNYILHIGSHPRPNVAYPGGGPAGSDLKLQMLGDAGGTFEQTVKLPAGFDGRFSISATKDGLTAPQPNFIRVVPFGNVMEVEPNNSAEVATKAAGPLPLAFNGIISEPGDVDFFRFTAKKGEAFDVQVYARALRSPLDAVLTITNATGGALASNDDNNSPDSYLSWAAPADGEYCLSVHDQLKRGTPLSTYRVEVRPKQPKLLTYLPEMVQNSSQERRAVPVPRGNRYATLLRVKRTDIGGDVLIDPKGLPVGVTVVADKIDKSQDSLPMIFEAKADAPVAQRTFELLPKQADGKPPQNLLAGVDHRVDVAENGNQRAYYSVDESTLPIAVTDEVPVMINLAQPKVPILQNGEMNLKVSVARKAGADGKPAFNGAVAVQLLFSPPGIGNPAVINIPEGQNEGTVTISANGNAPLQTWKTCIIGTLDFGKGGTWISTGMIDLEVAAPYVAGSIQRTYIDQGSEGNLTVKLDQKLAFDGKATITLLGLPEGVTSDPREITKDDKEVKFVLKATPAAQVGQHKTVIARFTLVKNGEPMISTIAGGGILRVDKNAPAKVADAKK
jgi:hypothetical protein